MKSRKVFKNYLEKVFNFRKSSSHMREKTSFKNKERKVEGKVISLTSQIYTRKTPHLVQYTAG